MMVVVVLVALMVVLTAAWWCYCPGALSNQKKGLQVAYSETKAGESADSSVKCDSGTEWKLKQQTAE